MQQVGESFRTLRSPRRPQGKLCEESREYSRGKRRHCPRVLPLHFVQGQNDSERGHLHQGEVCGRWLKTVSARAGQFLRLRGPIAGLHVFIQNLGELLHNMVAAQRQQ